MKHVIRIALGVLALSSAATAATTDSHTLFLNDCQPDGCAVHVGTSNATTDTSDIPTHGSTVQAFSLGDAAWAEVLSCVRSVMSPFDLKVTDERPTSGNYFEVMVAGLPSDVGVDASTLAVGDVCPGDSSCPEFRSNALAFAFANASYYADHPNDLCASALQALAASWRLDHVVEADDVMSYNAYSGVRTFHDGVACGSDCQDGRSPFGFACTGSGGQATHECFGTGTATQDEVELLLALFGPAPSSSGEGGQGGAENAGQGEAAGETQANGGVGQGGHGVGGNEQGGEGNAIPSAAGEAGAGSGGVSGSAEGGASGAGAGGEAGSREGGVAAHGNGPPAKSSGCGCRLAPERSPSTAWLGLGFPLAIALRRRSRRRVRTVRAPAGE